MRIKFLLIALFCVSLAACVSKQGQDAAAEIAKIFKAKNYDVKTESNYSTSEGSHHLLTLTLTDPENDGSEHGAEKIASTSALLLILNIDSTEGFDRFEIDIVNGSSQFNHTYDVKDLRREQKIMNPVVNTLSEKLKNKDFTFLRSMVEQNTVSDSILTGVEKLLAKIDSTHGRAENVTINGFKSYKLEKMNDRLALMVWLEVQNEKGFTWFRILIAEDDQKVLGFKFNDSHPIE